MAMSSCIWLRPCVRNARRLCVQLLSLFCPQATPDGTLLTYCDKPSLFEHMRAF